ncbi:MAG: hypothetical protein Ct9H300mP28_28120 [Pseudomonadota bacterium]|nr:MAG: hypothetical protein Ct9H300mP28_28120 [Pseudomonadota bacterium]
MPSFASRMVQADSASGRWVHRKALFQGLDVPPETDLQFFETSLPIPVLVWVPFVLRLNSPVPRDLSE